MCGYFEQKFWMTVTGIWLTSGWEGCSSMWTGFRALPFIPTPTFLYAAWNLEPLEHSGISGFSMDAVHCGKIGKKGSGSQTPEASRTTLDSDLSCVWERKGAFILFNLLLFSLVDRLILTAAAVTQVSSWQDKCAPQWGGQESEVSSLLTSRWHREQKQMAQGTLPGAHWAAGTPKLLWCSRPLQKGSS